MNHLTATYLASGFCCCRKAKLLLTSRERSLFFSFASEPTKKEQGARHFFVVLPKSNFIIPLATLGLSLSACCLSQRRPSCVSGAV